MDDSLLGFAALLGYLLAALALLVAVNDFVRVRRHRARYEVWHVRDELVDAMTDGRLPQTDGLERLRRNFEWSARHSDRIYLWQLLLFGPLVLITSMGREAAEDVDDIYEGLTKRQVELVRSLEVRGAPALVKMFTSRSIVGLPVEFLFYVAVYLRAAIKKRPPTPQGHVVRRVTEKAAGRQQDLVGAH